MDEFRITDEIYSQIKDFQHRFLTNEQRIIIDKLIPSELHYSLRTNGLCEECNQIKTSFSWCQFCNSKRFEEAFKNWTSGNKRVDEFIQKSQIHAKDFWQVLEWVDYNQFVKVKNIAKGGFGTIYTAIWKGGYISYWNKEKKDWFRDKQNERVALKSLNHPEMILEFAKEVLFHSKLNDHPNLIRCYGVTQNPSTKDYIMIMDYARMGSLRNFLNVRYYYMNWEQKFGYLDGIIFGLCEIHEKEMIHQDFHSGNILVKDERNFCIGDLGLCKILEEESTKKDKIEVFGVLPYIAPEVFKGQKYTKASDIYSYGIICYELLTGLPPFHDVSHDEFLMIKICNGLRPQFKNNQVPQLILDVIEQCWNDDPLKRPVAKEVHAQLSSFYVSYKTAETDSEIYKQCKKTVTKTTTRENSARNSLSYQTHPQAIYTSRLLICKKNLSESYENAESDSLRIDFIKSKESETKISESIQLDFIKSEKLDNVDIYLAGISEFMPI